MVTLTEFVDNLTPSLTQVNKALHVGLLVTTLATFFVVPLYSLKHGTEETTYFTILDDLTNTKTNEKTQPLLVPVYYAFLAFVLLGLIAQIFKAFWPDRAETYLRANWAMFIAAIIAAYAADQVSILVQGNTRPNGLVPLKSANGGLPFIALAVPAVTICFDAYKLSI